MTKITFPNKTAPKDRKGNTEADKRIALLKLEIQNSDTIGALLDEHNTNEFLGVVPEPTKTEAQTDKFSEAIVARDSVLEILKKIIKPKDVSTVLEWLQVNNFIESFNRFKQLFLTKLAGQSNLSFDDFRNIWAMFAKEIIEKSADTGIVSTDIIFMKAVGAKNKQQLEDMKNKYEEVFKKIRTLFSKDNSQMDNAFVKSFREANDGKAPKQGNKIKVFHFKTSTEIEEKDYTLEIAPSHNALWAFKGEPKSFAVRNAIKAEYITSNEVKKLGLATGGSIGSTIEESIMDKIRIKDETKAKMKKKTQIGKYYIPHKELHNNYFVYSYKSPNHLVKKVLISNDLKNLFFSLIDATENPKLKVNYDLYDRIDTDEKKIFDDFLMKTQASDILQSHSRFDDKDRNDLIKRFNLLRGQLLAGNNAPEIVNELKVVLVNLQDKDLMSEKDVNTLFKKIMLLK